MLRTGTACFMLLPGLVAAASALSQAPNVDEIVLQGRYLEVPRPTAGADAHARAVWAFARYHLACDREVAAAASSAHEAGEVLGSYVLLECLRHGDGIRGDPARLAKLNHSLRQRLLAKEKPTAFELLTLAATTPANEQGVIEDASPEQLEGFAKQRTQWLTAAADLGFAQAANQLGEDAQAAGDLERAYACFSRAALMGLAAGMKNQAFLQMQGKGTEQDVAAGAAASLLAAKAGDSFAMINLAMHCLQGPDGTSDEKAARDWIDRAVATGHWAGALEKALALLVGNYGFERSEREAHQLLEKAAASRRGEVLYLIAGFYARGDGVAADARMARDIAEAAYVQGCEPAAEMLAWLHGEGLPGLPADRDTSRFWVLRSRGMTDEFAGSAAQQRLRERLEKLDPFAVPVVPTPAQSAGSTAEQLPK